MMKNKLFYLLICTCICISCQNHENTLKHRKIKSSLINSNLKGNVKTVFEYAYSPISDSDGQEKMDSIYKIYYKFDSAGNLIEENCQEGKDNLPSKYIYKYNEKGL